MTFSHPPNDRMPLIDPMSLIDPVPLIEEYPPNDACLLYLIRHGATPHNLQQPPRMQGDDVDEPLAELGRKQAARAAESLADRPFAAVYASPMKRAHETAAAIAAPHGLSITTVDQLREVNLGEWSGKTWDEIRATDAQRYEHFLNHPEECGYPGGESLAELLERVRTALASIATKHLGQEVAVVAHSVVNRCYLGNLLGLPLNGGRGVAQLNTGISLVRWTPERAKVLTINDVRHLF